MTYRCTGSIHRPVGDCLRPIVGALVCYGYLDRDQGVPLADSLDGPLLLVIPTCEEHKAPTAQWAEHLWGRIADAFFVPPHGIDWVLSKLTDVDRCEVAPDPTSAVGIFDAV